MKLQSSTSRRQRVLTATAALAVSGVAAVALLAPHARTSAKPDERPPLVEVDATAVVPKDIVQWHSYSGRLEAVEKVQVRPEVSGTIVAVHFKDGVLVRKGDPLFTIDPRPYQAEVDRAGAQLAAAQARSEYAAAEAARAERLIADNAMARRDYDARQNAAREAAAGLLAARAMLASARLNLSRTVIQAPISGRVSRAEITVGNVVTGGAEAPPLTTLVSVAPIYASFEVDELSYLRYLNRNKKNPIPVLLGLADETALAYRGQLVSIDNQVDPAAATVRVRARFDNADGALVPGLFARVKLGDDVARPAVLVSDAVINTDQDKKFVLVANGADRVERREVTPGELADGLRIITKGLVAGDRVLLNNLHRVQPGDQVKVKLVALDNAAVKQP